MHLSRLAAAACALACATSCGESADGDTVALATGEFVVQTTLVDDGCLDGGLNLLFMPNGTGTPWEWPMPVTIHAEDELPVTYDIELREPFGQMTVTARDGGVDIQVIESETNPAVLLNEGRFGQCVADMSADVQVELQSADEISGIAELGMSDPRGDERCPREMPDACEVLLRFEAARQ